MHIRKKKNFKNKLNKINERKDKLTPENIIKKLNKKKIKFHNYFVKKIENHKKGILLKCSDGKKNKIFMTKKLVLGCGTLITTKLIMDYLNIKKEVRINHHPRLFSLYISKKRWKSNMEFQPSQFHLKSKKNPFLFTADFRPGNKVIVKAIVKFKKILSPFKFLINLFRECLKFIQKKKILIKFLKIQVELFTNFFLKQKKYFHSFITTFPDLELISIILEPYLLKVKENYQ